MTTIEVTQADIDAGVPQSSCLCPVARGTSRALDSRYVSVRLYRIHVLGAVVRLPEPARRFVADFDAGRPVAPFTFEVQL